MKAIQNQIIFPCIEEIQRYTKKWETLKDYVNQERALDKLFLELAPLNNDIRDILIKCSSLNDFYSTNIYKIHNVAIHFLTLDIDKRLSEGDLTLVTDLSKIEINGKTKVFYSFATKYCSHHQPTIYPIYDSYVAKLLSYLNKLDRPFSNFKSKDLKDYPTYVRIIKDFQKYYKLEQFSVKELDKYLWLLGKELFNKLDK